MDNSTSKLCSIRIPIEIVAFVEENYKGKGMSEIMREALILKLSAEKGFVPSNELTTISRGARRDMMTKDGRSRAEAQLAKARASRGKKKIKKLRAELEGALSHLPVRNVRINPDGSLSPVSAPPPASRKKAV